MSGNATYPDSFLQPSFLQYRPPQTQVSLRAARSRNPAPHERPEIDDDDDLPKKVFKTPYVNCTRNYMKTFLSRAAMYCRVECKLQLDFQM